MTRKDEASMTPDKGMNIQRKYTIHSGDFPLLLKDLKHMLPERQYKTIEKVIYRHAREVI